ncbi:MAG: hypothetical protein NVS3B20_04170 [Polyangiales bacterium]
MGAEVNGGAPEVRSFALRAIALATILHALALLVVALFNLLSSARPIAISPSKPVVAALTRHLVLAVVDGLRYDFAVDPARAPNIARHMREDAHAEVWAGHVTMTSSAVLTMGTGQRATFEQILLNVSVSRAAHNDLFTNARAVGLRSALAGDETWVQAFGEFDQQRIDRRGLAIEEDNSEEILSAAEQLAVSEPRPNLLVAHFLAPDHKAHTHGATSPAYASFLTRFDHGLQAFLSKLPNDSTVFVLSDHGALDNGNHGVDSPLERRAFLFAYGPGIRRNGAPLSIDQVDLGPTLAALLGIPSPAQGRGTAVSELLAIEPEEASAIACSDAARVVRLSEAQGTRSFSERVRDRLRTCDSSEVNAETRLAAGRSVVREWDRSIEDKQGVRGRLLILSTLAILLSFAVFCGWIIQREVLATHRGRRVTTAIALAISVAAIAPVNAFASWLVDNAPHPFKSPRGIFIVSSQVVLLIGILFERRARVFFAQYPRTSLVVVPGMLACAFPYEARTMSLLTLGLVFVLSVIKPYFQSTVRSASIAMVLPGDADREKSPQPMPAHQDPPSSRARRFLHRTPSHRLPWFAVLAGALGIALLAPYAFGAEDPADSLPSSRFYLLALSSLALVGWLSAFARSRDGRFRPLDAIAACAVAVGSILVRGVIPSYAGLSLLIMFPIAAVIAARAGRNTMAYALGFASYGLVSRPVEVLSVAAAAMVLEAIGTAVARSLLSLPPGEHATFGQSPDPKADRFARDGAGDWVFVVGTAIAALFAANYLARIGLQRGIDFGNIDWSAGTFGDRSPSVVRLGLCIGWKYLATALLLLWLMVRPFSSLCPPKSCAPLPFAVGDVSVLRVMRARLMCAAMVAFSLRGATLTLTLLICRTSFWTSFRMIGDIPSALVLMLSASLLSLAYSHTRTSNPTEHLPSSSPS